MPKYRTYISHPQIGEKEILLLGLDSAILIAKLESNEVYYVRSLDGTFKAKNGVQFLDSFNTIDSITSGNQRCDEIGFSIYEKCESEWILFYRGIIEVKNIKLNRTNCVAEFKVSESDLYSCMKRNYKDKINHYGIEDLILLMSPIGATVQETTTEYTQQYINGATPNPNAQASFPIGDSNWCVKKTTITDVTSDNSEDNDPNPFYKVKTYWWREVVTIDSDIELIGWNILNSDSSTTTYWRCPVYSGNSPVDLFRNGRHYKDVMEYTIVETLQKCTSKPVVVRSNFFSLNPSGISPSNTAYENSSKYYNLLMFQISDVVHHDYSQSSGSTGKTKQFELTLEEVFKVNRSLFQLAYRIDETDAEITFRVEHISYFTLDSEVMDMRNEFGRNEYSHNLTLPQRLKFELQNSNGDDFKGSDIVFPSSCTDGEKNYRLSNISTDLAFLLTRIENSEGEYEANSDIKLTENFVLIAAEQLGQNLYIPSDVGEISGVGRLNGRMSLANLHAAFWLDGASAWAGTLNNQEQIFETVKFGIEAAPIRKKFCCGDELKENAIYYGKSSDEEGLTKEARLKEFRLNLRNRTAEYKLIHGNT